MKKRNTSSQQLNSNLLFVFQNFYFTHLIQNVLTVK